jgi:hypothetical protein
MPTAAQHGGLGSGPNVRRYWVKVLTLSPPHTRDSMQEEAGFRAPTSRDVNGAPKPDYL